MFTSPSDPRRLAPSLLAVALLWAAPVAAQQLPGEALSHVKISDTVGGFGGALDNEDRFGYSIAALGDLDDDTVEDIAVGQWSDDDGGTGRGALWILFLNTDGTVKAEQKISQTAGSFGGTLGDDDWFGSSLAAVGDLDGDGNTELAVGAPGDDGTGLNGRGSVWILFLDDDGTVKSEVEIGDGLGGFTGSLSDHDEFGRALAPLGDLDGGGIPDLAVGAYADDDGGAERGAVYVLFLKSDGTVDSHAKISDTAGGFGGALDDDDRFGFSLASLGDLDGDSVVDLAVGQWSDDDGGAGRGAFWVVFLDTDGTVKAEQKISQTAGGFGGTLTDTDWFGSSLALLGDLDIDGRPELLVGAPGEDPSAPPVLNLGRGAAWVLTLEADGTVRRETRISDGDGGFTTVLDTSDEFGRAVAPIGDLDNDGVVDYAVGSFRDDDGGLNRGAIYVVFASEGVWSDLGFSLPGTGGIPPRLFGEGSLIHGEPMAIVLEDALPGAPAFLVVGLSTLFFSPFNGGTLVPAIDPPSFFLVLFTDGMGEFTLGANWPAAAPTDFTFYFQYWIKDAGGIFGFSGSNAISGTTPP